MSKKWRFAPPWPEKAEMALRWQVSPLLAQLLYNRGIRQKSDVTNYLKPSLMNLHPPDALPGVDRAADRIVKAIQTKEPIVIYGDYDVDGITGTAILWHLLTMAGGVVEYYVPHRLEEGYGLNAATLSGLGKQGAKLIVSVDCGVTAIDAAKAAREAGADLIITDHHEFDPDHLPEAAAIVHPRLTGGYPNPYLCGAGVAFKLAWAISQRLSNGARVTPEFRQFLLDATGLAALGTVADVVPLVGENRILAKFGLVGLHKTSLHGLTALIESSGLTGCRIDSYEVGFKLAPRLNAAGRMGHARLAIELLTDAQPGRAKEIADYLEAQNRDRQTVERKILREAKDMALDKGFAKDGCHGIVLASEGWHVGVIGIVASRLVGAFNRPTVMIGLTNGDGQGSARSVANFPMHQALKRCADHLQSYGGHAMAGGLRILSKNVTPFTEAFVAHANNTLTPADLEDQLMIDAEVALSELSEPEVERINEMGPFGTDAPKPCLATRWVDLDGDPRCVGANGEHLQFAVREGGIMRKGIAFGMAKHHQALRDHRRCRVAFQPTINEFNGRRSVEMLVTDIEFP